MKEVAVWFERVYKYRRFERKLYFFYLYKTLILKKIYLRVLLNVHRILDKLIVCRYF